MKKIIVGMTMLCAAFVLAACGPAANNATTANNKPANAATNTTTSSADADVKKMMTDIAAALAKNDADAAAKFYADDYHLITPDGVDQNKTERMADMRSGATKFDSFAYENVNVRTYGDTAVAIATVKARGVVSGKPRTSDMRATLVFRKMADGWKVVSGQATPIAATAAPATASNTASTANTAKPPANK